MKKDSLAVPTISKNALEHPIIQAICSEIPGVNAIATVYVETIRGRREKELYTFLEKFAEALIRIRKNSPEELDFDHLSSDEFGQTVANIADAATREIDEKKLLYLKQFLVNYAKVGRPDTNLRKVYFQFVSELSGMHLTILDLVFQAQKQLSDDDLNTLSQQLARREAMNIKSLSKAAKIDQSLAVLLCVGLSSRGLVKLVSAKPDSRQDEYCVIICPIARHFLEFIKS